MPDGYQPAVLREHLDRQEALVIGREAHQLRAANQRLAKQVWWLRHWLGGYACPGTLRLLEESVPGVFPGAEEYADKMA